MTKVVFEITDGMVPHSECFDLPGTEADIERSFVAWVGGFADHWRKDLATWHMVSPRVMAVIDAQPPFGDFRP